MLYPCPCVDGDPHADEGKPIKLEKDGKIYEIERQNKRIERWKRY